MVPERLGCRPNLPRGAAPGPRKGQRPLTPQRWRGVVIGFPVVSSSLHDWKKNRYIVQRQVDGSVVPMPLYTNAVVHDTLRLVLTRYIRDRFYSLIKSNGFLPEMHSR